MFTRRRLLSLAAVAAAGGLAYSHFSATVNVTVESFSTAGTGQKKTILVLSGSARRDGNSDLLAAAFAEGARAAKHTVHVYHTAREPMNGCLHCERCWTQGKPCVQTDAFDNLAPMLEAADLLVFCSPLYWYSFSGQLKCAIDRFYPYWRKNRLRELKVREAMLLMCGQSHLLRSFSGPVESYRQMLGYTRWKDRGHLFVTGVDSLGAIADNAALEVAADMGRKA